MTNQYLARPSLSVAEVAKLLGLTTEATRIREKRGLIPGAYRIGRTVLFDAAIVLDWLRASPGRK